MISDVHVHKHQHITNRPHGADILYEHHSSFFFELFSASQEAEAKFETAHPVTFLKKNVLLYVCDISQQKIKCNIYYHHHFSLSGSVSPNSCDAWCAWLVCPFNVWPPLLTSVWLGGPPPPPCWTLWLEANVVIGWWDEDVGGLLMCMGGGGAGPWWPSPPPCNLCIGLPLWFAWWPPIKWEWPWVCCKGCKGGLGSPGGLAELNGCEVPPPPLTWFWWFWWFWWFCCPGGGAERSSLFPPLWSDFMISTMFWVVFNLKSH